MTYQTAPPGVCVAAIEEFLMHDAAAAISCGGARLTVAVIH